MLNVVVFGGTIEGRHFVEQLCDADFCNITVCTATEYGGMLLAANPRLKIISKRLDQSQIKTLLVETNPVCVVDATHPYATEVTNNIAAACNATGVQCIRILREGEPEGSWIHASDINDAVRLINDISGNILLTTGSNDLPFYAEHISDFAQRVYARVLPVPASLEITRTAGLLPAHTIAMQGPFSIELNRAILKDYDIQCMVTKASGRAGGFWEKVESCKEEHRKLIVIDRPVKEEGHTQTEAFDIVRMLCMQEG